MVGVQEKHTPEPLLWGRERVVLAPILKSYQLPLPSLKMPAALQETPLFAPGGLYGFSRKPQGPWL